MQGTVSRRLSSFCYLPHISWFFFSALVMSKGGLSNVTRSRCSPFPSSSGKQADRQAWRLLRSFSHSLVIRLHVRPSLSRRLFLETFSLRLIFRGWTPRLASLGWWLSDSQWFIVPLRRRTSRRILGVRSIAFVQILPGKSRITRNQLTAKQITIKNSGHERKNLSSIFKRSIW